VHTVHRQQDNDDLLLLLLVARTSVNNKTPSRSSGGTTPRTMTTVLLLAEAQVSTRTNTREDRQEDLFQWYLQASFHFDEAVVLDNTEKTRSGKLQHLKIRVVHLLSAKLHVAKNFKTPSSVHQRALKSLYKDQHKSRRHAAGRPVPVVQASFHFNKGPGFAQDRVLRTRGPIGFD
jgi:hypothetical protein